MKRFHSDYEDQDLDNIQKCLKLEEKHEIFTGISETEDEQRIIREFHHLLLRKGLEYVLKSPIFSQYSEYNITPDYAPFMPPRNAIKCENTLSCLMENLVIQPSTLSPQYQEFPNYQEAQTVTQNGQTINPNFPSRHKNVTKNLKSPQSRYKNCYGLIVGKVIKSVKEYLKLTSEQGSKLIIGKDSRLYYIHVNLGHRKDCTKFESFIREYHTRAVKVKRNRGKTTVYDYLAKDVANGLILVDLIQGFLRKDNKDFHNYIMKGANGKKRIGEVLSDEKSLAHLREVFQEMEIDLKRL